LGFPILKWPSPWQGTLCHNQGAVLGLFGTRLARWTLVVPWLFSGGIMDVLWMFYGCFMDVFMVNMDVMVNLSKSCWKKSDVNVWILFGGIAFEMWVRHEFGHIQAADNTKSHVFQSKLELRKNDTSTPDSTSFL
jgi:hypothetical protein